MSLRRGMEWSTIEALRGGMRKMWQFYYATKEDWQAVIDDGESAVEDACQSAGSVEFEILSKLGFSAEVADVLRASEPTEFERDDLRRSSSAYADARKALFGAGLSDAAFDRLFSENMVSAHNSEECLRERIRKRATAARHSLAVAVMTRGIPAAGG